VALQLARLWLDRGRHKPDALKDFSGRTTEMTDYLAEQIVADLPESLREFLLETAILERFNSALADAVRNRSDSDDLLEQLRHFDALLIPLDDAREWFRYHPLFADFLSQRLKRSSAQRPVILRRRAAARSRQWVICQRQYNMPSRRTTSLSPWPSRSRPVLGADPLEGDRLCAQPAEMFHRADHTLGSDPADRTSLSRHQTCAVRYGRGAVVSDRDDVGYRGTAYASRLYHRAYALDRVHR